MGRITSSEYAAIANKVYGLGDPSPDSWVVGGFESGLFKEGMSWGATSTDFKGCVYVASDRQEAVVAFQGTVPRKGGDLLADLQIAIFGLIGMLPQYCGAAKRLFDRTEGAYPGYAVSFTGHSLGGALAQVMGHWTGLPFVTFNAPGMWGDIQRAKFALWSPSNAARSIAGTFRGPLLAKQTATTGRNFRNALDPVSAYGSHYGPVTRFWGVGLHSMDDLEKRVDASRWANVNPFDAAQKEWGEL